MLTHGHEDHIGALPYLLRELDGHPGLRHGVHAGAARGQARGARRGRPVRAPRGHPGGGDDHGRSVLDAVPARHALDPRRHGRRGRHAAAARSCTPATSRSTRRRSTAGPPTSTAWPRRRAGGACTCCCRTRPTPRRPATPRASGASGRSCTGSSRRRRTSSWSACFSSHIHRIQQVVNAARANERVVAFLGRSMLKSVEAARRLGLLHVPDEDIVDIEEVDRLDPSRVVVICTGSQGEPYSALSLDGRARAQVGEARSRRHRRPVVLVDPRERTRDPSRGRRALPHGRRRLPRARGRGARERPRSAGGAPPHAVVGASALVHPDPRRAPAPAAPRASRRRGRHPERPRDRVRGRRRRRGGRASRRSSIGSRPA